ncbi:unnamed protein product [Sphenostylis stenocarpa]|uniref:Uncharacterized protein n=1 Tax=Sphenostylis stenocarpa TaxID=92480 RepID=A0AA86SZT6_9FABA|nr:unnamed protein product [Sphenostylis stenocarpa]
MREQGKAKAVSCATHCKVEMNRSNWRGEERKDEVTMDFRDTDLNAQHNVADADADADVNVDLVQMERHSKEQMSRGCYSTKEQREDAEK